MNNQHISIPISSLVNNTINKIESATYLGSLRFPSKLEKLYQEERFKQREKQFIVMGIMGILLYNLFVIADYIMLPDIWRKSFFIRIGIVTPLMILGLVSQRIAFFKKKLDFIVAILIVLVSGSIILILFLSSHQNVMHYYSGIVLVVLCGNIVFRINFRCALFSSVIVCVMYAISSIFIMKGYIAIIFNSNLIMISGTIMSLIGSYYLEKEDRIRFLLNQKLTTERHQLQEINILLENKVKRDPLTKLYNRDFFDYIFDKEWKNGMRYKYPIGVIFLDIDDFKAFNDNYGHQAGDYVLKKVSNVLSKNANRFHEIAARYGGEEFVLLLPHVSLEEALKLAEKIRREVRALEIDHNFSSHGVITVSIGVCSVIPRSNIKKEDLLLAADEAMYHSKNMGKNRVTPCSMK
ncbi:GGDEF domain-containing protein [Desulfothermus sp.]